MSDCVAIDVWDKTLRYKFFNYVSNLLYIFEKKEGLTIEMMNLYFFMDSEASIHLFDMDKCLIVEPKKIKTDVRHMKKC